MKNLDSDTKKILAIGLSAFALVILLSILITLSFSKSTSEVDSGKGSGLFKSTALTEEENKPVGQTEKERQEEYESREEMPQVTEDVFYETIDKFLATGNFDTLDSTLRHWQETYKDSDDESESKSIVMAQYRGDIAYYQGIMNPDTQALSTWQFNNPEVLAACVAYSPIMKKYAAFINQDSVIIPAVSSGTNTGLRKSDKTNEELAEIRNTVNRTRRDETAFQQIAVYDMTLYGYPCQFIAVMDRDSMMWMPYSLKVTNHMIDLPTVAFGKEELRNNPDANLDVMIAIPAAISEVPEGVTGNIYRDDGEIPDSQEMAQSMEDEMSAVPGIESEDGLGVGEPASTDPGADGESAGDADGQALTDSAGEHVPEILAMNGLENVTSSPEEIQN